MKKFLQVAAVVFALSSCSRSLGYSVVLWSLPEEGLQDGEIVKVHVKSNIMKTYVASRLHSDVNFQVPLWQLSDPMGRRRLDEFYEPMRAFEHIYAAVMLDGLPVRFEPENTSRQVYRLRKDEIVKIIRKGRDETLTSGANTFEGAWYRVMMKGGVQGWCFSYNLRLFDETEGWRPHSDTLEGDAEKVAALLGKKWHPESYLPMFESGKIDLKKFLPENVFFVNLDDATIILRCGEYSFRYVYKGIETLTAGVFRFADTPLKVTVRDESHISVEFETSNGSLASLGFATLPVSIETAIEGEKERREHAYSRLLETPDFYSSVYGELHFLSGLAFTWAGFYELSPHVIPRDARPGGRGEVSFDYVLSDVMSDDYDGAISFKFETFGGMSEPIPFLYKLDRGELLLEDVVGAKFSGNTIMTAGTNPQRCRFAVMD